MSFVYVNKILTSELYGFAMQIFNIIFPDVWDVSFHICMTLPLNLTILYVSIIVITFFGKRLFKITNNKQTKNNHKIALKTHYV